MAAYTDSRPALSLILNGIGAGLFTSTSLVIPLAFLRRSHPGLLPPPLRSCRLRAQRRRRAVGKVTAHPFTVAAGNRDDFRHVRVLTAP